MKRYEEVGTVLCAVEYFGWRVDGQLKMKESPRLHFPSAKNHINQQYLEVGRVTNH